MTTVGGAATHAGRALVCAPRMPEFDHEGGSRRVWHLIGLLQEAGWAVSFVAQDGTGGERYAALLRGRGVAVYAGPESRWAGDEYLADPNRLIAAGRFDLALLHVWNIAEDYLPRFRVLSPDTRVVVDSIDLHFLRHARDIFLRGGADDPQARLDGPYADQLTREINTYAAADAVLTVSQKEADLINDLTADATLAWTVPDYEDLPPSAVPFAARRGMLFLGNFRHPPNVDAVRYLCDDILPQLDPALLAAHPVSIVGNALGEVPGVSGGSPGGVRAVGWVPSVVPYLHHARLTVVPLRTGAGTKRKLLQSLMAGTPAISTTIGVEGLGLRDDEEVLVADDPAAFAGAIARLLHDERRWAALATRGREAVVVAHGRETVRRRFLEVLAAVLARPQRQ
jgi:glycosyltransferase involved in cell wall biosynthesis